ncbi:STAS domain-containing protein [uncultured Aquitalea sp.]|uniref:STAS domain-containing protein n=1 Tax=uncultured Aquitalea sp. TaxID=540272 RepID=UPI0025CE63A2|nr:STAS domain-containing protein [uncultured Aquitalea sp.]
MFEETAPGAGRLTGKLDMNSSGALLQTLTRRAASGPLRLDISGIDEADSAAIALLLASQRAAQAAGHALTLEGWPKNLRSLVELYALDGLLGLSGEH